MKVLYVVGSNLRVNSSANMSHNALLKGLVDNNCEVEVIMSNNKRDRIDEAMPVFEKVTYYSFNDLSLFYNIVNNLKFRMLRRSNHNNQKIIDLKRNDVQNTYNRKKMLLSIIKSIYNELEYALLGPHTKKTKWIKNAKCFNCNTIYDIVISNSYPAASHRLVYELLLNKKVLTKRWIQVWEDPWYYDLFNTVKKKSVYREEKHLLNVAEEIYYVSPLTLRYQKEYFPEAAEKMKLMHLPQLDIGRDEEANVQGTDYIFGYFGDYHSYVRNLQPFYEACKFTQTKTYIVGNSDNYFESTDTIKVKKRVGLSELKNFQEKTDVLVHLCNLRGGQIPGKIYHYSATNKPILFILDGTEEEKRIIYNYFNKYNRYIFCNNDFNSIVSKINEIKKIQREELKKESVNEFLPKVIVSKIMKGLSEF